MYKSFYHCTQNKPILVFQIYEFLLFATVLNSRFEINIMQYSMNLIFIVFITHIYKIDG